MAMALSVSLRAFGDHLRLPVLIVVIVLAAMIGGLAPSPGGLGVVEAGMILGLTAAGRLRGRRHRRGLHPAPVHLVPAAHLGLGHPGLDAEKGLPMSTVHRILTEAEFEQQKARILTG